MERPAADPAKLLEAWMEWERGETMPGRVMSNLKTGGMREMLEVLVAERPTPVPLAPEEAESIGEVAEVWTPVV